MAMVKRRAYSIPRIWYQASFFEYDRIFYDAIASLRTMYLPNIIVPTSKLYTYESGTRSVGNSGEEGRCIVHLIEEEEN